MCLFFKCSRPVLEPILSSIRCPVGLFPGRKAIGGVELNCDLHLVMRLKFDMAKFPPQTTSCSAERDIFVVDAK